MICFLVAAYGSFRRKVVALVDRHPRALVAFFVVSVAIAVKLIVVGPGEGEPSSSTKRVAWELSPTGGIGHPIVRFEIDQSTDWLRLIDSRSLGRELFVHDGMVIVATDLSSFGFGEYKYVAFPVAEFFPAPLELSPAQIAPSLDRNHKECTYPSTIEDAYVRYFFGSEFDLSTPYAICGRSSYSNGSGRSLIRADEIRLDRLDHPDSELVLPIERLGSDGNELIVALRAQFGGFG